MFSCYSLSPMLASVIDNDIPVEYPEDVFAVIDADHNGELDHKEVKQYVVSTLITLLTLWLNLG